MYVCHLWSSERATRWVLVGQSATNMPITLDPNHTHTLTSKLVIPPTLLGKWTLLVGTIALLNGAQNFVKPAFSRKVYTLAGGNATPLTARMFATWNITSAVVRIYAAYNLFNPQVYQLAMWTYAIALAHFVSEAAVWKTTNIIPGIISPLIVASTFPFFCFGENFALTMCHALSSSPRLVTRFHVAAVCLLHRMIAMYLLSSSGPCRSAAGSMPTNPINELSYCCPAGYCYHHFFKSAAVVKTHLRHKIIHVGSRICWASCRLMKLVDGAVCSCGQRISPSS